MLYIEVLSIANIEIILKMFLGTKIYVRNSGVSLYINKPPFNTLVLTKYLLIVIVRRPFLGNSEVDNTRTH